MEELETASHNNMEASSETVATETVETTQTETTVETPETKEEVKQEETKPEETKEESKVPEKYEEFTLPEGMEYSQEVADNFKAVAKELGLPQEAAQKLVDFQSNMIKEQVAAQAKQAESWKQESEKSIGKDGIEQANRALAQFTSPEFVQFLNESGLGNHPSMIKAFQQVYNKIGESSFVDNNSGGSAPLRNDYRSYYPSMKDFYK